MIIFNYLLQFFLADDACASRPCLNFGNCLPSGVNDYICNCPLPYTSKDCSQGMDISACTAPFTEMTSFGVLPNHV